MEIPEACLIKSEILLREMQLTDETKLTRRALVRWLALALGLISARESRLSILPLLEGLFHFHLKERRPPNYEDLLNWLQAQGIRMHEKTIRYHLTNLRKAGIIEDTYGMYKFVGFQGNNLSQALEEAYRARANIAFERIRAAIDALEKLQE